MSIGNLRVVMASEYEFEVIEEKYKTFAVNLQNRTCDCGACQICGICRHVMPRIAGGKRMLLITWTRN